MLLDAVGVWVPACHHCPQKWMSGANRLEDELPEVAGKQLHLTDLVDDEYVASLQSTPKSSHADAFQFMNVNSILRDRNGTWMAGGREKCSLPIQCHDAKPLAYAAHSEIFRVESGSPKPHRADNLPDECRLTDAWFAGDEVR